MIYLFEFNKVLKMIGDTMFTLTDNNEVQYNGKTIKSCPNQSVALQLAINLSHKYGQLAEFQVEAILFGQEVK